ncbi:hypothetical protein [Novipirellula rosea]|uniref:DUF4234 domain-containing protein n=1 Tax=Novipirellula rosea TaxID=1031540 RepID=A0ABP8N6B9_9BACT
MPQRINPYAAPIRTAPTPTKRTYGCWLIVSLVGWYITMFAMSIIINEMAARNDRQQKII